MKANVKTGFKNGVAVYSYLVTVLSVTVKHTVGAEGDHISTF